MAEKKEALMRKPRLNRVCVLEDMDFYWDRSELHEIKRLWNKGISVLSMSEHFDRDPDELLLAIMHLAREDRITSRKEGLG